MLFCVFKGGSPMTSPTRMIRIRTLHVWTENAVRMCARCGRAVLYRPATTRHSVPRKRSFVIVFHCARKRPKMSGR